MQQRLGAKRALKRPAACTMDEYMDDEEDDDGGEEEEQVVSPTSTLPYQGILKISSAKRRMMQEENKKQAERKRLEDLRKARELQRLFLSPFPSFAVCGFPSKEIRIQGCDDIKVYLTITFLDDISITSKLYPIFPKPAFFCNFYKAMSNSVCTCIRVLKLWNFFSIYNRVVQESARSKEDNERNTQS